MLQNQDTLCGTTGSDFPSLHYRPEAVDGGVVLAARRGLMVQADGTVTAEPGFRGLPSAAPFSVPSPSHCERTGTRWRRAQPAAGVHVQRSPSSFSASARSGVSVFRLERTFDSHTPSRTLC